MVLSLQPVQSELWHNLPSLIKKNANTMIFKAIVNVLLFPRSLETLRQILAAKGLDQEAAEVPVIVSTWGKGKQFLEATWLMREETKGWGTVPLIELPAGTEDLTQVEIPDSAQIAEEMVALLRSAKVPATWKAEEICLWLAQAETAPEGYDEATQGAYIPQYASLDMTTCQPTDPEFIWHVFPGMTQQGAAPEDQDTDTNSFQGMLLSIRYYNGNVVGGEWKVRSIG